MTTTPPTAPATDPLRVALLTPGGVVPDWAPNGDHRFDVRAVDVADGDGTFESGLDDAVAAIIDAALGAPLSIARRVHRYAPAAQLVIVAEKQAMQDLRKAMLFAPGVGEVWLIEPGDADAELVERAATVGQRRRHHASRGQHVAQSVASFDVRPTRPVLLADQYLATLLELLPEPVLALDDEDRVLFVNPAASRFLAIDGDRRLSGVEFRKLIGAAPPEALDTLLERGRLAAVRSEVRVHGSGGERIMHISVAPVEGERPVRAVLLHDITDDVHAREQLESQATELETQREELQAQNEELQAQAEELESQTEELSVQNETTRKLAAERTAMLSNIADGVIIADAEGRTVFLNETARRIHGTEAVGVGLEEWGTEYGLFDLDGQPLTLERTPLYRALREGRPVRDAEWQVHQPDGTRVWAQGSAAPVLDSEGRSIGAVLTVRDVTERRARDEERERLLTERDRAVSELKRAISSRSRFYASMSHELRTPINAIIGYNDLLRSGVYGDIPDEQEVALERVYSAANHLLELINDILDLSKIEAGKLTVAPEPVVVSEFVADLRATMQPLADQHGAELRIAVESACERTFVTDPRRLRQIVMNLLSNAIRYGQGSPVDLRCDITDGSLKIEVEDRGPGIPEDRLEQIFDEFVQLGAHERGGTGLGLAIARALSEQLGGSIRARSTEGVGSVFTVELAEMQETGDDPES